MTVGENPESQPAPETPDSQPAPAATDPPAPAAEKDSSAVGEATEATAAPPASEQPAAEKPTAELGPLSAAARRSGPLAARGAGAARPSSPASAPASSKASGGAQKPGNAPAVKPQFAKPPGSGSGRPTTGKPGSGPRPGSKRPGGNKKPDQPNPLQAPQPNRARITIPSKRSPLADDIQQELDAELAGADFDALMSGMPDRKGGLAEGQRVHAAVLKIHDDSVFVSLGGPDEGMIPFEQFEEEPTIGQSIEVIVRGFSSEDGLYLCVIPGQTISVSDISDLEEGATVEATVTATNTGGLELTVGGAPAFMPISQITEHRIEDTSDFVGQKLVCVITECNPGRNRLVLSRRAVLERERAERRKEQMEQLEVGQMHEGIVRSIKDFGAFVDLGGCDGLIHISKLSWDRVQHPSEVLEEGQKVKVRIDQFDKETGKIGLSYRDLITNPWDTVDTDYPIGQVVNGTVTRVANFGAFVKLGPGIEGLIHISELAHHRVSRVNNVVQEGENVEVKVMSIDTESQRVGLSLKAATAAPVETKSDSAPEEIDEPVREPIIKPQHSGPLKGGTGGDSGGDRFGLRW